MDLLPQVSSEDLNETDLQGGNLAVHENAGEIQLHLKTHVDIRSINGGRPPEGEPTVGDLVQTWLRWVGGWVGGWVRYDRKEARVRMSYTVRWGG